MDLNELLHAHQIAVMKVGVAGDEHSRIGHLHNVAHFAERIRKHRNTWQKDASFAPTSLARIFLSPKDRGFQTERCTSDATDASDQWENEGGALDPCALPLPPAVRTSFVRQFHVGPYVYSDPKLALAEYNRRIGTETGWTKDSSPDEYDKPAGDR